MSPAGITPDQFSTFGELLRHLRRQARLTQRELGIAVGYSDAQISRIEQNQRVPDAATITGLFVPALYIEDQPKWITRLLELAKAASVDEAPQSEAVTSLPTGTVTFLFTDIEGSTKLAREYPDAMPALLARHHETLKQCIQAHNGYAFQIVGDSVCAAFRSASEALEAALDAQRSLHREAWSPAPLKVRIGIHTGTAHLQDASQVLRYSGYATLAITQRIMSAGHGGQILVSQSAYDLTRDTFPKDAQLVDLGQHRLRDALQPERIYQLTAPDLPSEFPPLNTTKLFNHNLPAQLTSFIGREKEIAEIKEAIEKHRLVTLTGSGGTGKTRLSLQVGTELLESFPDGTWFVELAPLADPALVPQVLVTTLGLIEQAGRSSLSILTDYLRTKRVLVIMDNCEHLIQACAQLVEALLHSCPDVQILATSREVLSVAGEFLYQVPALTPPDPRQVTFETLRDYEAVQLFVERARTVFSTFSITRDNATAIAQVCYHLDGIPLALELAAARVKMMRVEEIAARLHDRFHLLTGTARTSLPRHQTLHALIDWSHDLLTEPERVLFRRLSVFAGGWTLEAAEQVAGGNGQVKSNPSPITPALQSKDLLDLLASLVNKSLVLAERKQGQETRYGMLKTIRQYAHDKLWAAGEGERMRQRHLAYYVDLAERAEPQLRGSEQVAWLDRLEAEHDNLRTALEWSQTVAGQGAGGIEIGLRLAGALAWWWFIMGWMEEGRTWLERTLASNTIADNAQSLAATPGRAKGLLWAAGFAWDRGDHEAARPLVEAALAAWQELDEPWYTAFTFIQLGMVALAQQDVRCEHVSFMKSRRLFEQIGDRWGIALVEMMEGEAARFRKDDERAIAGHEAGAALFRAVGDEYMLTWALQNLAHVVLRQGDVTRASALFVEALTLARKFRSYLIFTYCLAGLGGVAAVYGHSRRAARLFGAADELFQRMGTQVQLTDHQDFERNLSIARVQLDEETFTAAWEEGKKMTLEQAIEYALEESHD